MLKKYYLLAVLVALGLWLLSIDTISSFVLANTAPRNQAERGFVTKLIFFTINVISISFRDDKMTHSCHPTFQSLARAHFPAAMKRKNVFISTCEIYLFPFAFTSHSLICPGKEHVSLKQTKHLIREWLQSHCRSLQKLSLWNMPVWMWWKLKVLWILAPLHLGSSAVHFNWPAWFSTFWFLSCFFSCLSYP